MADGTNNIYIESSFYDPSYLGTEDIGVEFFNDAPDNIGSRNIIVNYSRVATSAVYGDLVVVYTCSPTVSGFDPISIEYFKINDFGDGVLMSLVEYATGDTAVSGSISLISDYFVKDLPTSGTQFVNTAITIGDKITYFNAVPLHFWNFVPESGVVSVVTNYVNYSGQHDSGMNPIGWFEIDRDVISDYFQSLYVTNSGFAQSDVDITFAGWVPGGVDFDIFSSIESKPFIEADFPTTFGRFTGFSSELFSAVSGSNYINSDIFGCLEGFGALDYELETISGSCNAFYSDVWSGVYSTSNFRIDVDLFSMYFDNFTLQEGQYMPASGTLCVDIHDELYNVVASGTYMLVDGIQVSGTLIPISDGYRLCYNPTNDFNDLMGPTTFTVHAENDNSDILEQNFYITYGYVVEYDNPERIGLGYGYRTKVSVRMSAENMTQCPVVNSDGYWFETEQRKNVNLNASIVGIPDKVNVDLGASIYPQSTAFFYDKVFTMVLNARDYEGNEMEPFILEFKIKNDLG